MWPETAGRWLGGSWRIIWLTAIVIFIWTIDYQTPGDFSFCLFKNLTGHSCYGCGLLRGISALLHLDFAHVCKYNKLNIITIPLLGVVFFGELKKQWSAWAIHFG
jgi:hypothetical protein